MSARIAVAKTYKLFIGGKFPRSESGYTYEALDHKGRFSANVAKASRKDARDAVVAARAAQPGFASATAYNRGQILYRIAEILEGRREQFVAEIRAAEGVSSSQASTQVDGAIDTWVWYAGFADKYAQVAGNGNPVAGPYFNLSVPEPTGVVVALAPQGDKGQSLLGLAAVVAPILVSGNSVVVMPHYGQPLPALSLAEVLATSDVPGGVVNIISGNPAEVMPWLASHADVNAFDFAGGSAFDWVSWQLDAAGVLARVVVPCEGIPERCLERITAFTEIKTIWHTKALG
jgi:acyl-CoA reductase-like NAD-dependent aldehyde dehydrogenase